MLFVVFQCMKNVLAQFDTVDSSTVSKHINRTTVKHDVAFNPGSPTKRCRLVLVIMLLIAPPKLNILNFWFLCRYNKEFENNIFVLCVLFNCLEFCIYCLVYLLLALQ